MFLVRCGQKLDTGLVIRMAPPKKRQSKPRYRRIPSPNQFTEPLLPLPVNQIGDGNVGWLSLINPDPIFFFERWLWPKRPKGNLLAFAFELECVAGTESHLFPQRLGNHN